MAKSKHILTIEIELDDLSREEREELHSLSGGDGDCDDEEWGLPTADEVTSAELFEEIATAVEYSEDIWAGSNHYCTISKITLVKAEQSI